MFNKPTSIRLVGRNLIVRADMLLQFSNSTVCNITIILNLITAIDEAHNHENLIIIASLNFIETLTFERFMFLLSDTDLKPNVIISEMKSVEFNYLFNDNSLTIVFSKGFENDDIVPIMNRVLRGFRTNKLLFILYDEEDYDNDLIERTAEWLWDKQYINSIIAWKNEIWTFNPFPNLTIEPLKEIVGAFPFYQRGSYDLQGFEFSAPPAESLPRVFYKTDQDGGVTLSGGNGYLFLYFLDFMNMTWDGWEWYDEYNETVRDYLSFYFVTNYSAEMSTQASIIVYSKYEISHSYPTDIVDGCYMLPVRNSLPGYLYLIRPFSPDTWLILVAMFLYLTALMYGLLKSTFMDNVDVFVCFQQSLNVTLNSSNMVSFSSICFNINIYCLMFLKG